MTDPGNGRPYSPGFLVVSDDPALRDGLVADLDRRFGREYGVAGAPSADAADVSTARRPQGIRWLFSSSTNGRAVARRWTSSRTGGSGIRP